MPPQETVVLKFGGAAVGCIENYDIAADHVIDLLESHYSVIAVVSAMRGATDDLLAMAYQVNPDPPRRECDMLISVGERISCALLAMALAKKGVDALSFTGSQAGIITCENHTDAKILDVRPQRLVSALDGNKVAVVAGFQGVSRSGCITTLGRSGSDTSAVALAAAFRAEKVIFFKDVAGIYNANPKNNAAAKHLPAITYHEALALTDSCGNFLHPRCLLLAQQNSVPLLVRSFNKGQKGKSVVSDPLVKRPSDPIYER